MSLLVTLSGRRKPDLMEDRGDESSVGQLSKWRLHYAGCGYVHLEDTVLLNGTEGNS